MLSRKDSPFLIDLPIEWVDKVTELLQDSYRQQLVDEGRVFEVYGKIYKGEVLVIASLVNPTEEFAIATTYFVSMDLEDGQDHTKLLDSLVDSIGAFFDVFFATKDWMDYQDQWQSEKFKDLDIFYKINRENIGLTIKADQLLNQ
ncbi:MAG: hypothetical protein BM556_07420 [Bacteriovorax sp. MedPE-SWde]|nr:MAG: hypothetical protein BM556_07420 [Bacteriovorax sp. MedPE-SWde]